MSRSSEAGGLSIADLERAMLEVQRCDPQWRWKNERDAAAADDRRNRRGHLVLNPDIIPPGVDADGRIIEHEGSEYRVIVSTVMSGWRDSDGNTVSGYWIAHVPLGQIGQLVEPSSEHHHRDPSPAKPERFGGDMGDRTPDLLNAIQAL